MIRRIALLSAALAGGCAAPGGRLAALIDPDRVPIVYGGGASVHATFRVSPDRWAEFSRLLGAAADAAAERAAVGEAIGLMERIAGEQTITWMDKSCNGNGGPTEQGQLDCIDESTNSTTYLRLFEQRGLLRFHTVLEPVWRAPHLVDTHRTAVLRDLGDGREYSVDSWYGDNGTPARVQLLADWKRRVPLR